ncbi:MAG TPA: MBL fold metallo-hydrolase [Thermoanaerobaculia bacterium]|jgi:glyoxylase-like metal-dependent hydrolase (beta-lactamase superfamily II)
MQFVASLVAAIALGSGVTVVPGTFVRGMQPDGNTVILRGRSGLIVVDTGRHEEHTRQIAAFARDARRPVTAIVNTHWHLDHIGGNALLRGLYPEVRVFASDAYWKARGGFISNYRKQLMDIIPKSDSEAQERYRAELRLIDAGDLLGPGVVVRESGPRTIDGRRLQVHLERNAVTAGDVWLVDDASGIVIAGDLVTLPVPFFDTACPRDWRAALARLGALDFRTLVPGHGPPMTHAQFDTYRRAFEHLVDCGASQQPEEACIAGWLADAQPLVAKDEPAWLREMLHYYVAQVLRGRDVAARCGVE